MKTIKPLVTIILAAALMLLLSGCPSKEEPPAPTIDTPATPTADATATSTIDVPATPTTDKPPMAEKPVIYLYPPVSTEVTVQLEYDGVLTVTYPEYNDGWKVTAHPDGTLLNHADGKEYSYLFWEGRGNQNYDFTGGFVVKGSETSAFLQESLAQMGLLPKEYNEFIVYWLPQMQDNPYNLISFQGDAYTTSAKLDITPAPDSILRVFMTFKPLTEPVEVPTQAFQPFERSGFTVVEWGGCIIE